MSYVIQMRRGLKADLPASAPEGEAFVTTDTHELFVGTGSGMAQIAAAGGGGDATSLNGTPINSQAPEDGEILIFDGASNKYVPGDPVVSGPDAPGAPPTRPPVQVGIFDGTNVRRLAGDSSGNVGVNVKNFPSTQAVSATSLPLPTGAAKESGGNLDTLAGAVAAGKVKTTPDLPTGAAQDGTDGATPPSIPGTGIRGWLRSIYDKLSGALAVTGTFWQATQPVSAASLPLPTGAAKESGGNLDTLAGAVSTGKVQENVASWGGTAISAPPASGVPPVGTEVAPVVKPIFRKATTAVFNGTTTGVNTFTTGWIDTQATGDVFVTLTGILTALGGANTLSLVQSDDPANASLTQTIESVTIPNINIFTQLSGAIACRYWKASWLNNNSGTSTGEVNATSACVSGQMTVGGQDNTGAFHPLAMDNNPMGQSRLLASALIASAFSDGAYGLLPSYAFGQMTSSAGGVPAVGVVHVTDGNSQHNAMVRTPAIFKSVAAVAVTAGTPVAVWTPASGKKFRLMGFMLSLSVAGSVLLEDATGVEKIRTPLMAAGVGLASPAMGNGILSAAANNQLFVDVTASGSVSGFVFGTEE